MLPLATARFFSDDNALCTSVGVDDVMFSHNGYNRPESKTKHYLRSSCQVALLGDKTRIVKKFSQPICYKMYLLYVTEVSGMSGNASRP